MTPNGNIYFHPDDPDYSEDFSKESVALKALFLHEMTHVWQYQTKKAFKLRAIFNRKYNYKIDNKTKFKNLKIEQQASVIEDAIRLKARLRPYSAIKIVPIDIYITVISTEFPIKSEVIVSIINYTPPKEEIENDEPKKEEGNDKQEK